MSVRSLAGLALLAGTALLPYRLATINASTGVADYCAATDRPLFCTDTSVAAGDQQSLAMLAGDGTRRLTASGAINRGDKVYTDASGKISATAADGAWLVGIALEAASGDGSIIEIAPTPGDTAKPDLAAATVGAALTDSTTGTADGTVVDVTGAHSQSILNNNFADIIQRLNQLRADQVDMRAKLVAAGIVTT